MPKTGFTKYQENNIPHMAGIIERPSLGIALNNLLFLKVTSLIGKPFKASRLDSWGEGSIPRARNAFLKGGAKTLFNLTTLLKGLHVFEVAVQLGGLSKLSGDLENLPDSYLENEQLAQLISVSQGMHEFIRLSDSAEEVSLALSAALRQKSVPSGDDDDDDDDKPGGKNYNHLLGALHAKLISTPTLAKDLLHLWYMSGKVTDVMTWICDQGPDQIKAAYLELKEMAVKLSYSKFGATGQSIFDAIDFVEMPVVSSMIATPGTVHMGESHEEDSLVDAFHVLVSAGINCEAFRDTRLGRYLDKIRMTSNVGEYPEAFREGVLSEARTISLPTYEHFKLVVGSNIDELTSVDLLHTALCLEQGINVDSATTDSLDLIPESYRQGLGDRCTTALAIYEIFFEWYKIDQFIMKGDQIITERHPVISYNQEAPSDSQNLSVQLDTASSVFSKLLVAHQLAVDTLRNLAGMILPPNVPDLRRTGFRVPYHTQEYEKGFLGVATAQAEALELKGFVHDDLASGIMCLPKGTGFNKQDEDRLMQLRLSIEALKPNSPYSVSLEARRESPRNMDRPQTSDGPESPDKTRVGSTPANTSDPRRDALRQHGLLVPYATTDLAKYIASYGVFLATKELVRDIDKIEYATMGSIGNVEYNRSLVSSKYAMGPVKTETHASLRFDFSFVYKRLSISVEAPQFSENSTKILTEDSRLISDLVDDLNNSTGFNRVATSRSQRIVVGVSEKQVDRLIKKINGSLPQAKGEKISKVIIPRTQKLLSVKKMMPHQYDVYDLEWRRSISAALDRIIVDVKIDGSNVKTGIPDKVTRYLMNQDPQVYEYAIEYILTKGEKTSDGWARYKRAMLMDLGLTEFSDVSEYHEDMSIHHLFVSDVRSIVGSLPELRKGIPLTIPGYVETAHEFLLVEEIEVPQSVITALVRPAKPATAFERFLEDNVGFEQSYLESVIVAQSYQEILSGVVDITPLRTESSELKEKYPFMSEEFYNSFENDASEMKASYSFGGGATSQGSQSSESQPQQPQSVDSDPKTGDDTDADASDEDKEPKSKEEKKEYWKKKKKGPKS